jgi:hypothetical protein
MCEPYIHSRVCPVSASRSAPSLVIAPEIVLFWHGKDCKPTYHQKVNKVTKKTKKISLPLRGKSVYNK